MTPPYKCIYVAFNVNLHIFHCMNISSVVNYRKTEKERNIYGSLFF